MEQLAFGLTYAIAAGLCGLGVGIVAGSAVQAVGRNPEKINDLRTLMILGISFIDALAIIGFIVAIVGKVM
jgi:F-type H+-transporting ATPase subunit c